jgi:hypothetical protein
MVTLESRVVCWLWFKRIDFKNHYVLPKQPVQCPKANVMMMKGISLQQFQRNKKWFVAMYCRTAVTIFIIIRLRN